MQIYDRVLDFIVVFSSIVWEAMPFIVLGAVIAGILEELVPQRLIAIIIEFLDEILPRSIVRVMAIVIGALLGLVFPMCECGIVPVMRRLLRKRLPLSCCVTYMLAGPIINPVVILSTWVAFTGMENATDRTGQTLHQMGSVWIVSMRVGMGFLVACGAGMVVEWTHRKYGNRLLTPLAQPEEEVVPAAKKAELPALDHGVVERPSLIKRVGTLRKDVGQELHTHFRQGPPAHQRIGNIAGTALHDFVDITLFLILGALLAATTRQLFTTEQIGQLGSDFPVPAIALMMALAIAMCLCSEADAFVAASFITLRPAAKLAFLVLGPMLDFKLFLMYTRVFRPRLIWTIIACVVVQVFIYSIAVHFAWEGGILKERQQPAAEVILGEP